MLYEVITDNAHAIRGDDDFLQFTPVKPPDDIPEISQNHPVVGAVITSYSIHYTKLYDDRGISMITLIFRTGHRQAFCVGMGMSRLTGHKALRNNFV